MLSSTCCKLAACGPHLARGPHPACEWIIFGPHDKIYLLLELARRYIARTTIILQIPQCTVRVLSRQSRASECTPHSLYYTPLLSTYNYPSPQKMAKRKLEFENRSFQDRWEAQYMFGDVNVKAVCLLCRDSVAVIKEYNIREQSHQTRLLKAKPLQNRPGKRTPG